MKFPLLAVALALALVGCRTPSSHVEELASRELPVSSQGQASPPADAVIVLRHVAPVGSRCSRETCQVHDHWLVKLSVAKKTTANEWPLAFGPQIQGALKSLAERLPRHPHDPRVTEATLSVRAPAGIPYSIVHRLILEVSQSGLYRIGFDVIVPGGDASERRMEVPLPVEPQAQNGLGAPDIGIRVSLRRHPDTGALVRKREGWIEQVFDPEGGDGLQRERIPEQSFPCTDAGDAQLQSFVKQWLVEADKTEHWGVSAVVVAAGDVSLQDVIHLIDGFRAGGIEQIGFASELLK